MNNYPIGILIYKFFCFSFFPLIIIYYKIRIFKGKEDPLRFKERQGMPSVGRPDGKLVWVHCASVGEVLSALPIINMLKRKTDANFLITTGTVTSYQIIKNRIFDKTSHQYMPIDLNKYNKRFLEFWKPDLVLWFESELWPNILLLLQEMSIKHVIINARMSEKSFKKWTYLPSTAKKILSGFDLCVAQSRADLEKFKFFDVKNAVALGNIKYFSPKLDVNKENLEFFSKYFNNKVVWLAASTHEGEEAIAAEVHVNLSKKIPNLLTIIAPRHPERRKSIEVMLEKKKLIFTSRSKDNCVNTATDIDIFLADSIGEMGLWYSLCKVVLLGKSIISEGGQNPIEPSLFGCAIVCGKKIDNFYEVVEDLTSVRGIIQASSIDDIHEKLFMLLKNVKYAADVGSRAKNFATHKSKLVENFFEIILPEFISCGIKLK